MHISADFRRRAQAAMRSTPGLVSRSSPDRPLKRGMKRPICFPGVPLTLPER